MLLSRGCRPCERVRLPGRMKIGIGPCGSVMPYLTGNSAWSLGMTSFGNRYLMSFRMLNRLEVLIISVTGYIEFTPWLAGRGTEVERA